MKTTESILSLEYVSLGNFRCTELPHLLFLITLLAFPKFLDVCKKIKTCSGGSCDWGWDAGGLLGLGRRLRRRRWRGRRWWYCARHSGGG